MLSPYFPYPPHDGGKVRVYNLIKHLSKNNDIYLLSFIDKKDSLEYLGFLKKYCKAVHYVLRNENNRIISDEIPRSVSFFYTPEMVSMLEGLLEVIKPDIVQIDFLVMTGYIRHIKKIPVVYVEHDMSIIDFNQSFHDRDLKEEERFKEWAGLLKYEKEMLRKFDAVITLSERDRRILSKIISPDKLYLAPTGVDIDYYKPSKDIDNKRKNNILFVGHYRHYPNYDAVEYFIKSIFPLIIQELPNTVFYAVGSGASKEMFEEARDNIKITGEVEDIREYMNIASVFVAPVRLGGGIKGKILEAMASGVPVVATEEAASGIKSKNGENIIVAKNEIDFASKVIKLLKNDKLRDKIANSARKTAEYYYDWNKISGDLNDFYLQLLKNGSNER